MDTVKQKLDLLLEYFKIQQYWIKDDFFLKKSDTDTMIKYSFSDFCNTETSELLNNLNLLFTKKMYKSEPKEKSKKNKGKISRHIQPTTIVSNKKWSTNGKTGRIKKPKLPLLSDNESSERKEKIRNILISKGLCQIRS